MLRKKPGEHVYLFDGQGSEVRARVLVADAAKVEVEVEGPSEFAAPDAATVIHVGQGLTARNRLDVAVEKMTEAGVASLTPLVNFGGRGDDKGGRLARRWGRVSAAAAAQCGRFTLPTIAECCALAQWDARLPAGCPRLICSPTASASLSARLARLGNLAEVAVLVGRRSGLSADEEGVAAKLGFSPVSLGRRILRTETVGLVAISVILAHQGEY